MKKSLVLAMALTLGVAGTAFAANPFSDVPSDHWSYASVAKLAQSGVIQGYGDGSFRGDRTLTRYEMAEMIAKAMTKQDQLNAANKAMLEKLAAEYAAELKNLGVRVSKLEKNADNVKITGEMRARYQDFGKDVPSNRAQLRTRVWLTGEVNDNWKAIAMMENIATLTNNPVSGDGATDSNLYLDRAYVEGNFNKFKVTAGRYDQTLAKGMVMADLIDGIRVDYGDNNGKVGIYYGRAMAVGSSYFRTGDGVGTNATNTDRLLKAQAGVFPGAGKDKMDTYGIEASYNFKKMNVFGEYTRLEPKKYGAGANPYNKSNIAELGLGYTFDKNFNMFAEYIHGSQVTKKATGTNGWAARLNYGTFNRSKQGSYNIYAQYYDVPAGADLSGHADFGFVGTALGTKAWEIGADYAAQKNLRLHFSYGQGKDKRNDGGEVKKKDQIYTFATFYF